MPPGKAECGERGGAHRDEKRKERHGGAGDALGNGAAEDGLGEGDDARDRQVDEARPVHVRARGRVHAVLIDIAPRLPAEPVAHLHQPLRVVGIGKVERGDIRAVHDRERERGQQPDDEQRHEEAAGPIRIHAR